MGDAAFLEVKERGSLITVPTTVFFGSKKRKDAIFLEVKRERIADFGNAVFLEVKREDAVFLEVKIKRIADFWDAAFLEVKREDVVFLEVKRERM